VMKLVAARRALLLLVAALSLMTVAPAQAMPDTSGSGRTVTYTLHVAALPVDNLCNADAVILSGDLYIRETTTPARNGGYRVTSTINGKDLTGHGLPSDLDYKGEDREDSRAYYAPPPYPSTFYDAHYTKLVPQGDAPSMYLVIILKEVVMADGTVVPTINRMFLVCKQPCQTGAKAAS
jgi:hypothetical protein